MTVDEEIKQLKAEYDRIVKMWNEKFPQLSPYSRTRLCLKADFVLVGIELSRRFAIDNCYNVIVTVYSLWNEDIGIAAMRVLMKNKRYMDVKFSASESELENVVEYVKNHFGDILNKEIRLESLLNFFDGERADMETLFPKHNPTFLREFFESRLAIATYFNNEFLKEETIKELDYEIQFWDEELFQRRYGTSIAQWETGLLKKFQDRERFLEIINEKLTKPKIFRLPVAKIIASSELNIKFVEPTKFVTFCELIRTKWRFYNLKRHWRRDAKAAEKLNRKARKQRAKKTN